MREEQFPTAKCQADAWPRCGFCLNNYERNEAFYDGRIKMGPWVFMCAAHFQEFGVGLGASKGRRLIKEKK